MGEQTIKPQGIQLALCILGLHSHPVNHRLQAFLTPCVPIENIQTLSPTWYRKTTTNVEFALLGILSNLEII